MISDVPGDDPAVIASGPTVPGAPSRAAVRAMVAQYGVALPPAAAALLAGEANLPPPQSPMDVRMIATPAMALARRGEQAPVQAGFATPLILGDALEGEAASWASSWPASPAACAPMVIPLPAPCVLLSGGEATVTIRGGAGRARRPQHRVPAQPGGGAARRAGHLGHCRRHGRDRRHGGRGRRHRHAPSTLDSAPLRGGGRPGGHLPAGHDSYTLFDAVGDLVRTGPTLTNVNDFRAILVT